MRQFVSRFFVQKSVFEIHIKCGSQSARHKEFCLNSGNILEDFYVLFN